MPIADRMKMTWMMACHFTPSTVYCEVSLPSWPAIDEDAQQVDRRNADDRHRELDLEHAGVDVGEPFRLVGMLLQLHPRHERLVAADDHHDQQVRDHHHVDQAEHDQHDLLLGEAHRVRDEVHQFLEEQHHVDALRHDQPEIERKLQPARREDELRQRAQTASRLRRDHGVIGGHGHGTVSLPRREPGLRGYI